MAEQSVTRRLAAILAADMVGYSRLMEADETGTIARQKAHRAELIDPEITRHNGRIVKTTGDGLLVKFASVVVVADAIDGERTAIEGGTAQVGDPDGRAMPADLGQVSREAFQPAIEHPNRYNLESRVIGE